MKEFLTGIKITKEKGFAQAEECDLLEKKISWQTRKRTACSNLKDLESALKAYKMRAGIEAMFKDCKTGGYNHRRFKSFN